MGKSSVILFFTLLAIDMSSQVASSAHEGRQGFTENRGQLYNTIGNPVPEIKFKADFSSYSVYFSKNRFSYVLSDAAAYARAKNATPIRKLKNKHPDSKPFATTYRIDMEFLGADTSAEMNTGDELGGYDNFYFAHCPNGVTNVPTFSSITYKELYQGVNMEVMYSENGAMKYNLIIEPGADPSQIKMLYRGADDVEVENGHLIIRNSVHDLTEYIPAIFQQTPNGKVDVKGNYVVTKTADGFLVQIVPGHFDPSLELVIDPTTWVTYYGGNSGDESSGVTADAAGDEYTCGMTGSTTFPVTPGAFQTTMSTLYDCVLIKFGPTGTRQWATFFGGNNTDVPLDVMCDHNGAIIMTGNTTSSDFPITVGCFQNADAGFEDAFVAKFNPSGTLNFSTYFGGTDFDSGNSIAIDSQNNILITGVAGNAFPVSAGAYQTANGGLGIGYVQSTFGFGPGDAFILKLSPTGSRLWATYVGGTEGDIGMAIGVDSQDNVIIGGQTSSLNFPVSPGCFQSAAAGGTTIIFGVDAFLAKFSSAGNRIWATYIGGSEEEQISGLEIDSQDNIIATGTTLSTNFPVTAGCDQPNAGGNYDIFIFKTDANGNRVWATYRGTSQLEEWFPASAIDSQDNFYVYYEWEDSFDQFAILGCAYQKTYGGYEDQFLIKYNSEGTPVCSTYLGGPSEEDWDIIWGDVFCRNGYIYFCTSSEGPGFPVTANAFQSAPVNGTMISMVMGKICSASCGDPSATTADFSVTQIGCDMQYAPAVLTCDTTQVTYQWSFPGGSPSSSGNKFPPLITYLQSGSYQVQLIVTSECGSDTIVKTIVSGGADCDPIITAPNVFTPNGDNVNDGFIPSTIAATAIHYIIYDRWGMKVAEISGLNKAWDGNSFNGNPCTDGVYYYVIDATGISGAVFHLSGFVQLLRGS